jgi:type I restriction enzyme M protein
MTIVEILKDTNYSLDLLQQYENELKIELKEQKSGLVPYITCKVRKKR